MHKNEELQSQGVKIKENNGKFSVMISIEGHTGLMKSFKTQQKAEYYCKVLEDTGFFLWKK